MRLAANSIIAKLDKVYKVLSSGAVCIRTSACPSTALGTHRHESARPNLLRLRSSQVLACATNACSGLLSGALPGIGPSSTDSAHRCRLAFCRSVPLATVLLYCRDLRRADDADGSDDGSSPALACGSCRTAGGNEWQP